MNDFDERLDPKEQQRRYLDGLKRYCARGIPIYIDGARSEENHWNKIFEVCEDGSFYMGDFVVKEEGRLEEIHFDKVYYR